MMTRRSWLARATAGSVLILAGRRELLLAQPAKVTVTVYKDAGCGCCNAWVEHMRAAGFVVDAHDRSDVDAVKNRLGVPEAMRSCHTGQVGGYLIEGHVPAGDVQRLLRDRPKVSGLAIPGMPMSAPGMAQPGATVTPYKVIAFGPGTATRVYASYK